MARNLARFGDKLPPVRRQRGIHSTAHTTAQATSPDGLLPRKTEHSRRCAASARSHDSRVSTLCPRHCHSQRSCRAPTILWTWPQHVRPFAVDTRTVTSTPVDDSASQLSAHAAPLVSPRSSSTHGKLCDDPSPEDWILFRMFQRHERGSRLNSSFFWRGTLMPSEIKPETPPLLWVAFLWYRNCASPGPPGR
jgi:hypothetical protein